MESAITLTKTKWTIDPAHSEIGFKVKHLVFSNVRGNFKNFEATVYTTGDDFMGADIDVRIKAASIDTGIEPRNEHLRSGDFFETEKYPEIIFTANSLDVADQEGHFVLNGELTMRGIKNKIRLDVEFGGVIKDPWGAQKALFTVDGKINRKDWGLNYNTLLEAGGVLISEMVWIHCELQLIKHV